MRFLASLLLYIITFNSCSTIKLARDYAGWYINSEVEDAFDLNAKQEDHIEKRVDSHLKWFDQEFASEIVRFAELVLEESKENLDKKSVTEVYSQFAFLREMLVIRISDDAGYIFSNLSPRQKKVFKEYLEERSEKSEKRASLADKKFVEEIWEDRFDNLEEWFGDLSKKDKLKIKSLWPVNREVHQLWRSHRKIREDQLLGMVGMKPETVKSLVIKWAKDPETFYDEKTQKLRAEQKEKINDTIVSVYNVLTPTHKIYFRKKVQKLRDDIAALVKKEPGGS